METKRALQTYCGKNSEDFNFMEKEKAERFKKICRDRKNKTYKKARQPKFVKSDEVLLRKEVEMEVPKNISIEVKKEEFEHIPLYDNTKEELKKLGLENLEIVETEGDKDDRD